MSTMFNRVGTFLKSEDGPTATEYAVMLALIVIACIAAIQLVGNSVNDTFASASDALDGV